MAAVASTRPLAVTERAPRGRRTRHHVPAAVAPPAVVEVRLRNREQPSLTVDALCKRWRVALDAADDAIRAARGTLPPDELKARARLLADERKATLDLLRALAKARGVSSRYLHLARRGEAKRLLGLPAHVEACVFNLDGVLIGSATLHAAAWRETFDEFIWARVDRTRGRFAPYDPHFEYARYLHGKPRLEGVRAFLASRGISLPEGTADDPPGTETVHGLANRKNDLLRRRIEERGVTAYEGSVSYLETVREAGVRTAVVSASANTATILERSGLAPLVESTVDGNDMLEAHLRSKPAPDTLVAACRRLGVLPEHAAAFETTAAGVEAARAAQFPVVVGIDQFGLAAALRSRGAAPVVPGLAELVAERLAA
jgi:HAD superfamily hydrolase (TIGR01509 family)